MGRAMKGKVRLVAFSTLAVLFIVSSLHAHEDDEGVRFFEQKVRPLLEARCAMCHSGAEPKGNLTLSSRASMLAGGISGPAVEPGKPEESLLIEAIRYASEPRMPPKEKLPEGEIALLEEWVKRGAPWPEDRANGPEVVEHAASSFVISPEQQAHWAFQPVLDRAAPSVSDPTWARTPLDRFIQAKLDENGLRPAAEADRRTLFRRLSYDLLGLPPDPVEVDAFVADPRPDAYERLVDRLLASPAFGQRWARHWLDVVRYADSLDARGSGAPGDILDAWRYRDWVVDSFNRDLPYSRFMTQQVAGDVVPPASPLEGSDGYNRAGVIASTMLAIGNWGNGDADKDKILTDIADDQVDVVSKAFLGLTVSCARCHDHKFDPISQEDYYGLAGIFFSTHILPKLTPKGAGETIIRVPLASKAELSRRDEHAKHLASVTQRLESETTVRRAAFAKSLENQAGRYLLAAWDNVARAGENKPTPSPSAHGGEPLLDFAMRQWTEALSGGGIELLEGRGTGIGGIPGIMTWTGRPGQASATANTTNETRKVATFTLPARSISVHPGPATSAVVSWLSPITGDVRISGRVSDGDAACGNGVLWSVEHRSPGGRRVLAKGDVANGAGMSLGQGSGADALSRVAVREGDCIELLIDRRNEYSCDTTTVEFVISAWEGAAAWDLTRDCLADFHAGNPHADRLGHGDVWSFGDSERTATEVEDANSAIAAAWKSWRQAVEGSDRGAIESAAHALGASLVADPRKSPFFVRREDDETVLPPADRSALDALRAERAKLAGDTPPPLEYANAAQEGGVPESPHAGSHDVRVHLRGRYDRLGPVVERRFPTILAGSTPPEITSGSGRAELAAWLSRDDQLLTARVIVNRLWQQHMGAGIVRTASNFGMKGERPTHPELLDWLARRLVESGWSLKAIHREILCSATFRQSSRAQEDTLARDPENRLFSRMNRRRLEAEPLRDTLLAAAGRLDLRPSGPPERDANSPRRALYVITVRSDRSTYAALFDQADSTAPVEARTESTVAPQALFLLNHPFVIEQSRAFAARLAEDVPTPPDRVRQAYRLLFGREPTADEQALGEGPAAVGGTDWEAYCQVLLCLNELIYVD
jgi:hypothetical protein